jgi:CRISPR-associated protein Cmr3
MAYIQINPTDSLFFGGGKPFNAGADSWTDSSFLPNSSVIWGALFSVLYRERKINIVDGKVSKDQRERLKIKNIYFYIIENRVLKVLLPTPLDIFIDECGKTYLAKVKKVDFISSYKLKYISMVEKDNIDVADNRFIEMSSLFKSYSKGIDPSLRKFETIFRADYKIGIAIDKETKTVKEKNLYRIDLTQFENKSGFLIEYEFDGEESFEPSGILKLGGEGKTAKFNNFVPHRVLKELDEYRDRELKKIKQDRYFKLYFKTPALLKEDIKGLKLLSANVGKYIPIGGFDMEENKIKEMKKFIPAGSIFVYKIEDNFIEDIREHIEKEIEFDESYKGFGLFEILSIKEKIDE